MPDLAIIAESEIWPMTILELGARRVPQVLVNGRLSDRSFAPGKSGPISPKLCSRTSPM
jgi:3-deoxy-D-manno-octulosonic-acid transferase